MPSAYICMRSELMRNFRLRTELRPELYVLGAVCVPTMISLLFKNLYFLFDLLSLHMVLCRAAALKCHPVHHP